jgi:hypothetical protein
MFDRLMEDFCQFDDFRQAFYPHWRARLLTQGAQPAKKRGPQAGLADSEIMTILVLYHSARFKNFKAFYEGIVLALLRPAFPKAPCYARFIALTDHVWVPLTVFLLTWMGRRTSNTTSTARRLPCVTTAASAGTRCSPIWPRVAKQPWWFFGFKLQIAPGRSALHAAERRHAAAADPYGRFGATPAASGGRHR